MELISSDKNVAQERVAYLKTSSMNFIKFIEKFCDQNAQMLVLRAQPWVHYHEMIDLLKTRLCHLEDPISVNFLHDLSLQERKDMLTFIVDEILQSSNKQEELTYEQNQKIDIFLRLSNILDKSQSNEKILTDIRYKLKTLSTKEENFINLALYKKFKSIR